MRWREFATPIPASNPLEQMMGVVDNVAALALKVGVGRLISVSHKHQWWVWDGWWGLGLKWVWASGCWRNVGVRRLALGMADVRWLMGEVAWLGKRPRRDLQGPCCM